MSKNEQQRVKQINEVIARFKGETPTHFKRIIAFGMTLGAIGAAILGAPVLAGAAGATIVLPPIVNTIAGYMVAIGSVAAAVSKTAVTNPEDLPK